MKTPYEAIGGHETVKKLVDSFYNKVAIDPILKDIFPEDLTETKRKQYQFLTQFLGGEPLFSMEHGHPMLRARHMPFSITPDRADAWLACMKQAMDDIDLEEPWRSDIFNRLTYTAQHMINTPGNLSEKGEKH
jgi:hemoglobin